MCDVDLANIREPFPLHLAASLGRDKIALALIQNGANVDAENKEGLTPLFNATLKGFFYNRIKFR